MTESNEEGSDDLTTMLEGLAQKMDQPVMPRREEAMDPYFPGHQKVEHLRRISTIVEIGESLRSGHVGTGQDREKVNKVLSKELDDYLSIIGG